MTGRVSKAKARGRRSPWAQRQRREIEPDAAGTERLKIPKTRLPEPVMPGIRGWRTPDGWLVVRVHYTADPDRDDEWVKEFSKGYRGGTKGRDWQRELEIDFGAYLGDPVYPDFQGFSSIREVNYNPHLPLWRGWDFGYRNPGVVFAQLWPDDTLVTLAELFPTLDKSELPGLNTADLARMVLAETDRLFPGAQDDTETAGVLDYCDPAGVQTKETSDFSSVEHLNTFGINPEWSVIGKKNRVEYLRNYVEERHEDGSPKFLIHPRCTLTIKALEGGYHYPDENKGGVDRDMPDTSKGEQAKPYIHLMDAMEYIAACELAVEEAFQRRRELSKPKEDDGLIAGDSMQRYILRQDLHEFEEDEGRAISDPELFVDQLLGIETSLDDAFEVL